MADSKITSLIRTLIFFTVVLTALLAVRVADLQGFRGEFFRKISEENRQFRLDLPAERGVFLDRFGDPLVMNTRQYFRSDDPLKLYSSVTPLTQEEAMALQIADPFSVSYTLQRQYLRPHSLAHVLGYTSIVTADDLSQNGTLKLTDTVGRMGLESQYDSVLRGKDGYREFEINSLGEKQSIQLEQAARPGQSLRTTLDPYLATVSWRAMGEKMGAVVIFDADTGALLSLVSTPGFDSNLFSQSGVSEDQQRQAGLQQALADERKLFFNRSVSGTYPPGSIFKLVTAAAGLDSGAFDLTTTVDDQGILEVGEYRFANWYYTQYGRVEGVISLVRALARSNDIFFYRAAEWTGVEALVQKAHDFGFGSLTGIQIPGEKAGLVPDPEWKERTLGERWFLGNTYHLGIGQGDLLVTPLQLARMVGSFGSEGRVCQLSVVAAENRPDAVSQCSSLGLKSETLAAIQEGMIGACSAGGTAFPFFDWNAARLAQLPEGISPAEQIRQGIVACKTGTAEFGSENEAGHRRTHAWFGMVAGGISDLIKKETPESVSAPTASASASAVFTEDESVLDLENQRQLWLKKLETAGFPDKIAILVLVESDETQPFMEGSRDAAPIARTIFDWIIGQ